MSAPTKVPLSNIIVASREDAEILAVKKGLFNNNWQPAIELDPANNTYKLCATEFCLAGDILLRGTRIVMPHSLRQRTLELAHEGHPGMTAMKHRLRAKVWWPRIDSEVDQFVKRCRDCLLVSAPDAPEPLKRMTLPNGPLRHLAIDFLGPLPNGTYIFAVVDYYSRFLEIKMMQKIDTKPVIRVLHELFARHGVPLAITCDNGPQFISTEF